jgi:transposase
LFLNALIFMARSGGRWNDLPERFGKVSTVKSRYYRWVKAGVIAAMLEAVADDPDMEWLIVDTTVVRAHPQAAGARREKGGPKLRAWAAPAAG